MSPERTSGWDRLLPLAFELIDQSGVIDYWTLGGGTAIMLQIEHRESYDIDLFVRDAQFLHYLDIDKMGATLSLDPSDTHFDGSKSVKYIFDGVGEVDFIGAGQLTNHDPWTKHLSS